MLNYRVMPALLLRDNGLVKTIRFKNPKYVGDPINIVRIFNEKEVDELMLLDIHATRNAQEPNYDMIERVAGECFIPLSYGGGIRNVSQARRIFSVGVEKICVQSAAFERPAFVSELSDHFGSQSIVLSVDVKRNWFARPRLFSSARGKAMGSNWIETVRSVVAAGAGEVLLNAVDKDGTLDGPDLGLISELSDALSVPLISLGGVSSLIDIKKAVDAGASAVAAGSYFIYQGPHRAVLITYPKYEELRSLFCCSKGVRGQLEIK